MKKIFAIVMMLFLFSFVSPAFAAEKFFEIRAKQFVYTPNIIKVNKGDKVRIRLISEDVSISQEKDPWAALAIML